MNNLPKYKTTVALEKELKATGLTAEEWLERKLKVRGIDANERYFKGEMMSDLCLRYAASKQMTIDQFLRWLLKA